MAWRSTLPPLQGGTHQQVFWFNVSVDNIEAVQVLDGAGQVEEHAAGISLCVFVRGDDCVKEIAALEKQQCWMTDTTDHHTNSGLLKFYVKYKVPLLTPWWGKAHCEHQSLQSEAQCWDVSHVEGWILHSGSCAPGNREVKEHKAGDAEDTLVSPNSCEHGHADLSPAFILADDLQSIFSPCGSLHTLSDDGKVSVPQSPADFVPLCYGDGDGGVLIHQLCCGVARDKIGKVKIETRPKIVMRSYLHCRDHRPHPWSCKPLWRLKKVKNHCAGIPEGQKEL